ncbi:ketopantoate reductase family protein [Aneurinibacillus sp. Ricciae_BoGa-3]|uniref:ketopantoate reductase family protein n=1 Tax=Aneurinibacillus sp. Ricciae_BoGa-3 TaxID=3022697 RepID=UPI0023402964|nr:ketopantoate reductase family protein [Aneurinibacillus sp. Ricciae_BoGa-3]WCK54464.1 ketopantoate reductase family protein [Aneurinibacillus sp. Ricciae_BoGa-3]
MHIVVLGAGAVGGYFGGKLALSNVPVTFLVREKRFQQLQDKGLQIKSIHGDFSLQPALARSAEEISNPDVVLIALKNYHLQSALPEIRTLVKKGAKILPLLNGIEHYETLTAEFGQETVLGGLCYIESTLDTEGKILQTSPMQDIIFGSFNPSHAPWMLKLQSILRDSGANVRLSDSIIVDIWQKFIFLTIMSGITAATRKPIGEILTDPVTYGFLKDMIQEVVTVAQAEKIGIPADTKEQILQRVASLPPEMTSSLHRDLEKGLPLEIDSLQGYVYKLSAKHGLSVPCIRSVYSLLHPYKGF